MTLTEEQMNAIADEFENDTFQHEDAPVYTGSHYRAGSPQSSLSGVRLTSTSS